MSTKMSRGLGRARLTPAALLWLLIAFLFIGITADTPGVDLDPSWRSALNTVGDLRFGPDLVFTYGPWGFLDVPLIVHRPLYALALVAEISAAGAVWIVAHRALTRMWTPAMAAPWSTFTAVVAATTEMSATALCAVIGAVLLRAVPADDQAQRSTTNSLLFPAGLAALAGFLLQVKISDGVLVLALALVSTLGAATPWTRLAGLGAGVAALGTSSATFWLAREQSLVDFPVWLRGSIELVRGYGDALALEAHPSGVGYLAALGIGVLTVVVVLPLLRGRDMSRQLVVLLVVILTVAYAFKAGFTRHDRYHEPDFFILVGVLLVVLAAISSRRGIALVGSVVALALAVPSLEVVDPVLALSRWQTTIRVLHDSAYVEERLAVARMDAQATYALPEPILAGVQDIPVSIDPWETSVAWAYDLDWSPTPVFQTYAVVTEYLDRVNARAITAAPADQRILRRDGQTIDLRNQVWDAPQYQLAVACHYTTTARVEPWRLLEHRSWRCGQRRSVLRTRVEPGQVLGVPEAGDREVLIMTFTPVSASVVARLAGTALKVYRFLEVTADGQTFRVPRALASGPLLVAFPAVEGGAFDPFAFRELAFNEPGEVSFTAVPLR